MAKLKVKKKTKADVDQESAIWDARSDLDTLRRAEEIRANKDRMKSATIIAKEELKAIGRVVASKKGKKK